MRDLRKVREESLVRLTHPQLYGLLALGALSLFLTGLFGYYLGLGTQTAVEADLGASSTSLIPSDVEGESVAQLLALARERQVAGEPLVLDYHELLPETVSARPKRVIPASKAQKEVLEEQQRELDPEKNVTEIQENAPDSEEYNMGGVDSGVDVPPDSSDSGEQAKAEETRKYTLQVSSFQDKSQADSLIDELKRKGFESFRVEADVNGVVWYRVRVGKFEARASAEAEMERLAVVRGDLRPMVTVQ